MKDRRNKKTTGKKDVGASRRLKEKGEGKEFKDSEVKETGEKRKYRAGKRRSMRRRNENGKGRENHTCSLNFTTSAGVL